MELKLYVTFNILSVLIVSGKLGGMGELINIGNVLRLGRRDREWSDLWSETELSKLNETLILIIIKLGNFINQIFKEFI